MNIENFYTTLSIPYNEKMARGHTPKNAHQRMEKQKIALIKELVYKQYFKAKNKK